MEGGAAGTDSALTVLLIEDSRTDAELIASLLARSDDTDFGLTVVRTLVAGLEWLASHRADVVLLDLTLPDSEGLDEAAAAPGARAARCATR